MYRVLKLSGKLMAMEFDSMEDEAENIGNFVDSGDVVILCSDLEDLYILDIDPDEIEIVG